MSKWSTQHTRPIRKTWNISVSPCLVAQAGGKWQPALQLPQTCLNQTTGPSSWLELLQERVCEHPERFPYVRGARNCFATFGLTRRRPTCSTTPSMLLLPSPLLRGSQWPHGCCCSCWKPLCGCNARGQLPCTNALRRTKRILGQNGLSQNGYETIDVRSFETSTWVLTPLKVNGTKISGLARSKDFEKLLSVASDGPR